MVYLLSRPLKTSYQAKALSKPFCVKYGLLLGIIIFCYYLVFLNNPPWTISSSFMIQPIIELKDEFIIFKEGDTNQIITSFESLTPYDQERGKIQMSIEKIDNNNDTITDIFSVKIDVYETPSTFNAMTIVIPVEVLVEGQMRFLMEDYIIFSIDQPFESATVIGDLTIQQRRLINQNFPLTFTYNQTLGDIFTNETLSVTNILGHKTKKDEYVDYKYQVYGNSPSSGATKASIDILIGFIAFRDGTKPFLAIIIPLYLLLERFMTYALSKGVFLSRRQEDPVIQKLKHKYN